MSKQNKQECEGCRNLFPTKMLEYNKDLDLICPDCMEQGKRDKRSWNALMVGYFLCASAFIFIIYKSCSK